MSIYLKGKKELDAKKWDEFLELIRRDRIERKNFLNGERRLLEESK